MNFFRIFTIGVFVASLAQNGYASLNWTNITPANSAGQPAFITDLFVNPINSNLVYGGTVNDGLFVSTNGGVSWQQRFGFAETSFPSPTRIAPSPSNPDRIYSVIFVNFSNTVYSSNNGGQSWNGPGPGLPILSGYPQQFSSVAVDPTTDSTAYAASVYVDGSGPGSLYKTTNGGASWSQILTFDFQMAPSITVDPHFPNTIYLASGNLRKSVDGGSTWTLSNLGVLVKEIKVDPSDSNKIYATTNGWVRRSTDGGTTWTVLPSPSGQQSSALAVDANNPGTVFAAGGNVVYVSHNSGASWTSLGSIPLSPEIHELFLDEESENIFARNVFGRVYRAALDISPPVTTANVIGAVGSNGWYTGPVNVALFATDPDGPVASTKYSLDGGPTTTYSGPFTISGDGIHQLTFFSIDAAGNQESPNSLTIKIDQTAPAVTVAANPSILWPPNGKTVTVTVSGTVTESLSGVSGGKVAFAVTDSYGIVQPSGNVSLGPNGSYVFTVGLEARRNGQDNSARIYTVNISAKDNAGNQATTSLTVTVPHDQGH